MICSILFIIIAFAYLFFKKQKVDACVWVEGVWETALTPLPFNSPKPTWMFASGYGKQVCRGGLGSRAIARWAPSLGHF